ncbi:cytochrome P450 81Q32 [Manihot esculenta]|uniref:Cytochrome P450 n=1 Tax=Manihot esculenta TaxID=3983 RepID=A0A2C9UVB9_MANES|nr:cytochrome P450 81Q32 [Manihot esculenta]
METALLCSALSVLFLLLALKFWLQARTRHKNLPPSPPGLPIIGHLHLLKQPIHRSLHNLSQKYGPIISLRFGSRLVVIVSSPSAVEECFTKNDIVLANRPPLIMGKYLNYNNTTLVTAPYGDHWRNLRRISALEIFSSNRLCKLLAIRRHEIKIFLNKLYRDSSEAFTKVELKPMFSELTFNIIMHMITGRQYCEIDKSRQFREIIRELFKFAEVSYLGDFLPFLQWVDYQGFVKKLKVLCKRIDGLLQGLVDDQRNDKGGDTIMKRLLSLQESQEHYFTDEIIKGLIMNMIFAGTDTTAVTLEWAMANLLNHPQVLEKAKSELDLQIGQETLVDESDISKLPYLQNIISETLRLCPAAPLLLPHFSSDEYTIGGYDVPKNTMVFVNAWAIHRDPRLWDDAEKFKPERFEKGRADEACGCYKFMTFGLGRRACPGMGLAHRVLSFALGAMIQCFEWKRVSEREIDMAEGNGLTMPMAGPLEAMCKARDIIIKEFSSLDDSIDPL